MKKSLKKSAKKKSKNVPPTSLISLKQFGEEEKPFFFSEKDSWLKNLLEDEASSFHSKAKCASFRGGISRSGKNFLLNGSIELSLNAICDRCGKEFSLEHRHRFEITLILQGHPIGSENQSSSKHRKKRKEQSEWGSSDESPVMEEIASTYLAKEEVDLSPFFLEQSMLTLPMQFLCKENCPGLCPYCGKDLSEGLCSCKKSEDNSTWDALKGLKLRS